MSHVYCIYIFLLFPSERHSYLVCLYAWFNCSHSLIPGFAILFICTQGENTRMIQWFACREIVFMYLPISYFRRSLSENVWGLRYVGKAKWKISYWSEASFTLETSAADLDVWWCFSSKNKSSYRSMVKRDAWFINNFESFQQRTDKLKTDKSTRAHTASPTCMANHLMI